MAKSLMANMIKNKHSRVKADAEENKKLVSKNKNSIKKGQPIKTVVEEVEVMKESKTLMLD